MSFCSVLKFGCKSIVEISIYPSETASSSSYLPLIQKNKEMAACLTKRKILIIRILPPPSSSFSELYPILSTFFLLYSSRSTPHDADTVLYYTSFSLAQSINDNEMKIRYYGKDLIITHSISLDTSGQIQEELG